MEFPGSRQITYGPVIDELGKAGLNNLTGDSGDLSSYTRAVVSETP